MAVVFVKEDVYRQQRQLHGNVRHARLIVDNTQLLEIQDLRWRQVRHKGVRSHCLIVTDLHEIVLAERGGKSEVEVIVNQTFNRVVGVVKEIEVLLQDSNINL